MKRFPSASFLPFLLGSLFAVTPLLADDAIPAAASPAAKTPAAHIDDPAHLLPLDPPAAETFAAKLAAFEQTAGVKILVRFHPKSPSAEEDEIPGAFMRALAAKSGTVQRGALAVYFADEDDWRVWIGDDTTPAFVGRPGTAKELTRSGAIHEVKEAYLAAARANSEAALAALKKSAPADKPPGAADRVKLQTDAILDGLFAKFAPK